MAERTLIRGCSSYMAVFAHIAGGAVVCWLLAVLFWVTGILWLPKRNIALECRLFLAGKRTIVSGYNLVLAAVRTYRLVYSIILAARNIFLGF